MVRDFSSQGPKSLSFGYVPFPPRWWHSSCPFKPQNGNTLKKTLSGPDRLASFFPKPNKAHQTLGTQKLASAFLICFTFGCIFLCGHPLSGWRRGKTKRKTLAILGGSLGVSLYHETRPSSTLTLGHRADPQARKISGPDPLAHWPTQGERAALRERLPASRFEHRCRVPGK